jgi:arylformamidase
MATPLYRGFTSQEELDPEYDVEAIHPDFGSVVELYVGESARAREELGPKLGVRFGPTLDEHVDVFPPRGDAGGTLAPIFVFIHGGYWRALSSLEFSLVARGPVDAGCLAVVTNYSLTPKVTIEEITRQSRAVIAWLHEHAAEHGGDRDRIFVAGHSAGGQQAAMLLATDWEGEYGLPADVVKGGVAISGVFDLRPLPFTWVAPKLALDHRVIDGQSPLLHPPDRSQPLLVTWGGRETSEFRRQSEALVEAWQAAGLPVSTFAQPEADHFTAITGFADASSPLSQALLAFMGVR